MTTFQALIDETRLHLMTGQQDKLNVLASNVDDSTDQIPFLYEIKGVHAGATICIDLEELHVLEVSSTIPGASVTVIRGVNGSTAAAHTTPALIRIAPQFSDFRIAKFINEALYDLSAEGLFRILDVEVTFNSSVSGYDLTAPGLIDIWRVRYETPGPSQDWPVIVPQMYQLDRDADPTDFPSGNQLLIREGGYVGRPVRVSYRAGFGQLTLTSDDVLAVSGLHNEAHNIPPLGAAIALLGGREIKRSFLNRQPEPRRQQEVPPGSANQAMLPLIKRYEERIRAEVKRLRRQYPGAY